MDPRESGPLRLRVDDERGVAVPDRDALRRSRRTGCVKDLREVVGLGGHLERRAVLVEDRFPLARVDDAEQPGQVGRYMLAQVV